MPEDGTLEARLLDVEANGNGNGNGNERNRKSSFRYLWEILLVAWPQTVVTAITAAFLMIDSSFVGHVGTDEMVAFGYVQIWFGLTNSIIQSGFAGPGFISLTSQAMGAKQPAMARKWLEISMKFVFCTAILVMGCWYMFGFLTTALNLSGGDAQKQHSFDLAGDYAKLACVYYIPDALLLVVSAWIVGLDSVASSVPVYVGYLGIYYFINTALVDGVFGVNGLGFYGMPFAIATNRVLLLGLLVLYMHKRIPEAVQTCSTAENNPKLKRGQSFLKQCVPSAIWCFVQMFHNMLLSFLVMSYGKNQFASYSTMLVATGSMQSLLQGTIVGGAMKISSALGSGKPVHAKHFTIYLITAVIAMGLVFVSPLILFPGAIARWFSNDEETIAYFVRSASFAGLFYLGILFQGVSAAVLQAQGRPMIPLLSVLFEILTGLPFSYLFCTYLFHESIGVYAGVTLAFAVTGLINMYAIVRSDWQGLSATAQSRAEAEVHADADDSDDSNYSVL
eukprot:CAMPEP_0203747262 /NCGR_PEP_ID=MMETSP0098-20131031/2460_1 /ASSEMBLY_ACC=CAM_ASM_000208 /TAXON_ID=96639 /ORGANISM=" , Strain NY0313808BC1" /LENGTH=505 /DNA_ID=CAMNT_0050635629 /DNA_START=408 /DNA_END=1925 /DNA_ORIENTATION=+